jgi:hypothetical protein
MLKTLSLIKKNIPITNITGNTTRLIVDIHFNVNLKKLPSFLRYISSPSSSPFSVNLRKAYSWAENCSIIFEKPRSANMLKAARLVKRYQYPCCSGDRKRGISINVTGPEINRHT